MDAILVDGQLRVPAEALAFRAVRSGGPGGQNVNKVSSKVELRVDLERVEGLEDDARQRLLAAIRNQLDADGRWIVTSDLTRDQSRNLDDAREKIRAALAKAHVAPRARHATRPTHASQIRRVDAKKREGAKKRERKGSWD